MYQQPMNQQFNQQQMNQQQMNQPRINQQQGMQQPYGMQSYGGQQNNAMQAPVHDQTQQQQAKLQDQDLANFVLSELKRVAREYTTAALEASNPIIRRTFESQLHKTLQMQEQLYQVMKEQNMYGAMTSASQQDIHKEIQNHAEQANKLQSFMMQNLGGQQGGYQAAQSFRQPPQVAAINQDYGMNQSPYSMHQGQQQTYARPSIDLDTQQDRNNSNQQQQYQSPQHSLYQSAAKGSEFNTTGSRQTSSHATGAESDEADHQKEEKTHSNLSHSKYMM
jgi:spore coat protein CotF